MTNCFHVCFTSHSEVMFRNDSDYIFGIFSMVLAAIRTGTTILAFALMSDHVHIIILTSSYSKFVSSFRDSYCKHFNKKYSREGPLGEESFYHKQLIGTNHIVAAISYVLRNPIHHGICKSPFEYEFTSSTCYFRKYFSRKFFYNPCLMSDRELFRNGLSSRNAMSELPSDVRIDGNGMIIFSDFVDIPFVENHYVTGRRFTYYMTRLSSEEWQKEQMEDNVGTRMSESEYFAFNPPITIDSIEPTYNNSDMIKKEGGNFNDNKILDKKVCEIIDSIYVPKYHVKSYFHLSLSQKRIIANEVRAKYFAKEMQLQRCLAM